MKGAIMIVARRMMLVLMIIVVVVGCGPSHEQYRDAYLREVEVMNALEQERQSQLVRLADIEKGIQESRNKQKSTWELRQRLGLEDGPFVARETFGEGWAILHQLPKTRKAIAELDLEIEHQRLVVSRSRQTITKSTD